MTTSKQSFVHDLLATSSSEENNTNDEANDEIKKKGL